MVLYICETFHENISNSFHLTERTQLHGTKGYVQRAITSKVGSWCLTFLRKFMKISQTVFTLQSRHKYMVEMAMFNVQRAITPKVGKPELLFMNSACCLTNLKICVEFHQNI